jgi:hypothetical protein
VQLHPACGWNGEEPTNYLVAEPDGSTPWIIYTDPLFVSSDILPEKVSGSKLNALFWVDWFP